MPAGFIADIQAGAGGEGMTEPDNKASRARVADILGRAGEHAVSAEAINTRCPGCGRGMNRVAGRIRPARLREDSRAGVSPRTRRGAVVGIRFDGSLAIYR